MPLPKITSAMLLVTHACNLACRYCFVHQEPRHMRYETAVDAADFLIANADKGVVPEINFFGGEPLVMFDSIIKPLTLYIRQERKQPFRLSMTSNCVLLDDEKIDFMRKHDIGLLFSIDGAKATQDYNRPFHDGSGSFEALRPLIPKIAAAFPGTTFRMTVIPHTCAHLFENIRFAEESGFRYFFAIPDAFQVWSEKDRSTLKAELRKYADYYIGCYRTGKKPPEFSTLETAFRDIRAINAASDNPRRCGVKCSAGGKCGLGAGRFAAIHPDGSVYGCQEMTSNAGEQSIFCIGSIYDGIDEDRRKALMALFDGQAVTGGDCAACRYDRICDGGCVANNYLIAGDLCTVPEVCCWWKQTVLDEAIYVMQVLGGEKNEAFKRHWEA